MAIALDVPTLLLSGLLFLQETKEAPSTQSRAAAQKPNILFILTDDHRPDAMGCYGNASIRTPSFDRLAAEGARLDRFYVAAPLCCPSRAAFLTGLYPHQNGVENNAGAPDLRPGTPTVATLLGSGGYVTGFVGKAHMGGDPRAWGFKETPVWLPRGASRHRDPSLMVDGKERVVEGVITKIFADEAIAWIEKHKTDRWFLWLATTSPHTPYLRDPAHAYVREEIKPPPLWAKGEELSSNDWPGYYSTIGSLDAQVGRVLKKLDDLGLADKTFVFVAGDNGFMMGSHGYPAKSVWFEESARVPALARWPGRIEAGTKVGALAVSVDLMPTLCEIAGVAPPKAEGVSMLPALSGKPGLRKVAFSELRGLRDVARWKMVRTEKLKYVKFDDGTERIYDVALDPDELRNLAPEEDRNADLVEMRGLFRKWLEATSR